MYINKTKLQGAASKSLCYLHLHRSLVFVWLLHQCEISTKVINFWIELKLKCSFKMNFNPRGGHKSARTWPEHFAPKHADFVCLCPAIVLHHIWLSFWLFWAKERKNSLKSCKMSRILVPRLKDVRNSRPSNCVRAEPWQWFNYKS